MSVRHAIRLPLGSGGTWDWEIADPAKLLQLALDRSPFLQELYAAAVGEQRPSATSPWSLAIGFDEFVPGVRVSGGYACD